MGLVKYIAIFVLGARLSSTDHPLLPIPPLSSWKYRFQALLSQGPSKFPLKNRMFLIFRALMFLIMSPIWVALWTLDDIFFPRYRDIELKNPVFLVGGFRTGSTSLHRALSLDSDRYCSPRFVELAFPFLTIHFLLDGLEWIDKKFGTAIIDGIEKKFQKVLGEECMARHPMAYYEAEEDDVLLAAWHLTGWYICTMFPDSEAWISSGQQTASYSKGEQDKSYMFYLRSIQKVLYRRGDGRELLSKSHLIEFMFILERNIPNAKFVGTVRNPKDTFVSWYALAQAASKVMAAGWNLSVRSAVDSHLKFWDLFTAAELKFFGKDEKDRGDNKVLVPFKTYIASQEDTVRSIYDKFKLPMSEHFEKALVADNDNHKAYKAKRGYDNPSLEDLGISGKVVEERLNDYIDTYKLK